MSNRTSKVAGLTLVIAACISLAHVASAIPYNNRLDGLLGDPDVDVTWKKLNDAPNGLSFVRTAQVEGHNFLVTGRNGNKALTYMYDAAKDEWADGPSLQYNQIGSNTLTRVGNYVCSAGGFKDSVNPTNKIACADVNAKPLSFKKWQKGLKEGRVQHAAFALNSTSMMVCGGAGGLESTASDSCEVCNVQSQTCSVSGVFMPYGLNFGHAAIVKGQPYIFGHWLYPHTGFFDAIVKLEGKSEADFAWVEVELDQSEPKGQGIGTDFAVASDGQTAYIVGGDQEVCVTNAGHQRCFSTATTWSPDQPTIFSRTWGDKFGGESVLHKSRYQLGLILFGRSLIAIGGCHDEDCGLEHAPQSSVEAVDIATPSPHLADCKTRIAHKCGDVEQDYCCGCISLDVVEWPGTPNCYKTEASSFCNVTCPPI